VGLAPHDSDRPMGMPSAIAMMLACAGCSGVLPEVERTIAPATWSDLWLAVAIDFSDWIETISGMWLLAGG
jgi:hypothetical protein